MNEKGNVFDVSATLMEIDDLPESETAPHPEDSRAEASEAEPHYFSEKKQPLRQADVRRRALAALGVVGGGAVLVTMISAAVGMGNDQPGDEQRSPARVAQPLGESSGPVVQASRPRTSGLPKLDERPQPAALEPKGKPNERDSREDRADAHADRRREHAKAAPPPEPDPEPTYSEPTYTPEPEPTYVPVETVPPPAPSPPPASGGGQEFGIEP